MNLRAASILYVLTLREFIQRRAFQLMFLCFLLFFASIPLWKHFAPETRIDFLQDVGIGLLGFYLFLAALIAGTETIPQDLERRRFLFFITHPMGRLDYLLGRWSGAASLLAGSGLVFLLLLKAFFYYRGTPVSIAPAFLLILKYLVFLAFLFALSPVVERFSAFFLGAAFFLFSNFLNSLEFLAHESEQAVLELWVRGMRAVLPRFDLFDPGVMQAGDPAFAGYALHALLYGAAFITLYLIFAWVGLRKRSL